MKRGLGSEILQAGPVMECIFSHLNMRDASRCGCVCRQWRRTVTTHITRRRFIQSLAITSGLALPVREKLLQNLWINPGFAIALGLCDVEVEEDIRGALPPSTQLFFASTELRPFFDRGLIGTTSDGLAFEWERSKKACVSIILIPALPDFGVHKLHSTPAGLKEAMRRLEPVPAAVLILQELQDGEEYHGEDLAPLAEKTIGGVLLPSLQAIGVGPEYWNAPVHPSGLATHNTAFLFTGEAVQAETVLLLDTDRRPALIRARFQDARARLGARADLPFCSFAFFMTCCARGAHFHKSRHVESRLFLETFPQTPVIGLFTVGELAWNDQSFDRFAYSTAILIVTIG